MTIELQITIDTADWQTALPEADALVRRAAQAALAKAAPVLPAGSEVGVLLTSDAVSRRLNHGYRGRDAATNVLAFATGDESVSDDAQPVLLGDIVVALGVLLQEADAQDKRAADHLAHLVVHGVLHLLGHDHEDESAAAAMEALEIGVLADLGIANPYAAPGASAAPGPERPRSVPQEVVKA